MGIPVLVRWHLYIESEHWCIWVNKFTGCGQWFACHQGCLKNAYELLTHWSRVTHICVSKLTIIGQRQDIIWTNGGIWLIGRLGTNFSEIFIAIQTFSFKKMHLKMLSAKCCLFRLSLNVLNPRALKLSYLDEIYFFKCKGKICCVEFQGVPPQNILPIQWKIWFIYIVEKLGALRFTSF